MATGAVSWNTCNVYATWHNQDGSNKDGSYSVTIPNRVCNGTDDVIIPAGVFSSGPLVTTLGAKSLELDLPANDDPDNDPVNWGQVIISVKFKDGAKDEVYVIDTPVGGSINLRQVILPATVPTQAPFLVLGVPGGAAQLSDDGTSVLDLHGNPILSGSGVSSYNDLTDKPVLSPVALSGSYTDLSNTPVIPTLPTLATVATSGAYADLSGRPALPSTQAPANVQLAAAGQGELVASWSAVTNALGYTLSLDGGAAQLVTGTSHTYTGLDPDSAHTVSVYALMGLSSASGTAGGTVVAAPTTPPIQSAILADAPDYYWPFDDAPGTAAPRNLGSTPSAISAVQSPTLTGHSCQFFNGDDCWAVDVAVMATTSFTLEAIITGMPPDAGSWFSDPNGLTTYYDKTNGLGAQINTQDATNNFIYKNWYSAPDGGRHHVAIRYDGATMQLYLDGTPSQYGPYTLTGALTVNTGANCWIGASAGTACGVELSDVAVWHSALTPDRIAAHAAAI